MLHLHKSDFIPFSGSKSLNPFGRVGQGQSEKMRKLYGQIPPIGNRSDTLPLAERLAFFLCDFLLETGPLAEADELDCELEEVHPISNHSDHSAS